MMTVAELIEELRKYPPDMHVVIDYDGGWTFTPPELSVQKSHFNGDEYSSPTYEHIHRTYGEITNVLTMC